MEVPKLEIVRRVDGFEVTLDPKNRIVKVTYQGKDVKGEPVQTINGKKVRWASEGTEIFLSESPGCIMKWINGELHKFCSPGEVC